MKKTISIFLILTFLSSPGYALAPSLVSDAGINPGRSAQLQGDIAAKLEPGAIGNGAPLIELAQGKLPPKATLAESEYEEIHQKLLKAIHLAIKQSIDNENKVPQRHRARAKEALANLILLQNNLSKSAYLYNADIRGSEDYLLGFNFQNYRGFALEVVKRLYNVSPQRLAQYIYHECVPETGVITERDDHRLVYNEIQSAIFGQDEVTALKKDLRRLIDERTTVRLAVTRIAPAPRVSSVGAHIGAIRPPLTAREGAYLKRWYSAFKYARKFNIDFAPTRKDIRKFFLRFNIEEQAQLFELISKAFSVPMDYLTTEGLFNVLLSLHDLDDIKNDLEFCIKTRGGVRTIESLKKMRKNVADTELREIWLDLAAQLVSNGIRPSHIIADGSVIAKQCVTPQELKDIAALIVEAAHELTKERLAFIGKEELDSDGRTAIDKFLSKALAMSKNVSDLSINLRYLRVIAAKLFHEPETIGKVSSPEDFHLYYVHGLDKLILEARSLNMSGQGFDISVVRETYIYPTDENNNTIVTTDRHQEVKIIPGSIRVPIVASLPAAGRAVIKTDGRDMNGRPANMEKNELLGAIGNGVPLAELAQGKLPPRAALSDKQYQDIVEKLKEATELAIRFSTAKYKNVETSYQPRVRRALANLVFLKNNLSSHLYLFNAIVGGPEDYLVGFNLKEYRGIAVELVNDFYGISPRRLAQYIYHECVPEEGDITDRNDHRAIYNNIQSAIFGMEEVSALKKNLRSFIDSRAADNPVAVRIVVAPKEALMTAAATARLKPPHDMESLFKRWVSAIRYSSRYKVIIRANRVSIRNVFLRFNLHEQEELFGLVNRWYPRPESYHEILDVFRSLERSSADFDQVRKDIEFSIEAGQGHYATLDVLPQMRRNITDINMQKIWLDLMLRLAPMGIFLRYVIKDGSAIAKICKTPQELEVVAGLVSETSQILADEGKVAVNKKLRDDYALAVGRLLTETLIISKNVEDLAINLKYLEIIGKKLLQAEKIYEGSTAGIDKLILEAKRLNMSGQGFEVKFSLSKEEVEREVENIEVTRDGSWTYGNPISMRMEVAVPEIQIVKGDIWVSERGVENLSRSQISEDLPLRAKIFAANLAQVLAQHPDQLFFMGIETDIGELQKAQIMPIYKAIDQIKEMKDSYGRPLFPNLMVKRGKAADLVAEVAGLKEDGKLALNNTFIGARKFSVDSKLYDSIKGEGKAWIAAIDDSRPDDYLPVFESITLSMMAYLNADQAAIKRLYDAIAEKPIDPVALQDMIRNRIIYILPRATKFDIRQLRDLYELAQQLHTAA